MEDGESLGGLVEMMKQIGHAFTLCGKLCNGKGKREM